MKKYDAVAVIGKYTDRSGHDKSRYLNCGFVNENEKGQLSIKLDALPVGNSDWNGWLSFFEPKQREQKAAPKNDGFEDSDLPF